MMFFFVDNPRNDAGITTPITAGTNADGEGVAVGVGNPPVIETRSVVEDTQSNPEGEFFFYTALI